MGNMVDAKTETLRTLLRHYLEQPNAVGLDAESRDIWLATLTKTAPSVDVVALEVNATMNDLTLTQQGQMQKLMKVGPHAVPMFANVGIVLSQADQAQTRLRALAFGALTARPKGDATEAFGREREARDFLRTMSHSEKNSAFLKAVDTQDLEVVRAMLTAPGGAMVSDEIRARGEEAYAKRTNPAVLDKLKAVAVLREQLTVLATQVAQWLLHLGASPEAIQYLAPKV